MKRTAILEAIVFVVLLAVGAGLRVQLSHLPNFAPVAALALFAGYWFRSWAVGACLPLAVMGISDYFIGGYDTRLMMIVHLSLALPAFWWWGLRRRLDHRQDASLPRYLAVASLTSLAASCSFFLLSNFGTWLCSEMYEPTAAGLARCYWNAIPFFRHTLIGDCLFTWALFGSYALAVRCGWQAVAVPAPALAGSQRAG